MVLDICCIQVVVDFSATWCGPCRIISPVFVELSKKFPQIFFLKVDVDELRNVAQEWNVQGMPTFIFIKNGKAVDKIVGANKAELERKVAALATRTTLSCNPCYYLSCNPCSKA